MTLPRLLLLLSLVVGVLIAPVARAQDSAEDAVARLAGWQGVLDRAAAQLAAEDATEDSYQALRAEVLEVAAEARAAAQTARGTLAITRQMVAALGDPPAEGAAAESPVVAAERARLSAGASEYDSQVRQAELIATRGDILLRSAAEQRLDRFTRDLLRGGPSPLDPASWAVLPEQAAFLRDRLLRPLLYPESVGGMERGVLAGRALLALATVIVGWFLRRWLLARFGHRAAAAARPDVRARAVGALAETIAHGVLPAAATLAIALLVTGWIGDRPSGRPAVALLAAAAGGLVAYFLLAALGTAALAPRHPAWRLARIADCSAVPLCRRVRLLAAALAAAGAATAFLEAVLVPSELHAVIAAAALGLGGFGVLAVLPGRLWVRRDRDGTAAGDAAPAEGGAAPARGGWKRVRVTVGLVVLFAFAAALLGYTRLGIYLGQLLVAGALVFGVLLALRGVGREALGVFVSGSVGPVARARRTIFASERGLRLFEYVAGLTIDLVLLLLALAVLLPLAGLRGTELADLGGAVLRGVTVGGITISPLDIVSALVAFTVGIAITRFIQRRLDERMLVRLQVDHGLKNSIRTGVGYLGVLIAGLVAIGVLGLDLSNLALIAGALSVGIGFGLQAIVSNFVAGLILLVERPVKVGDWVVVGGNEGLVRRISVRATEIQTFRRASVIVPNAELISGAVVNWTHKDKVARIDIPILIEDAADPEAARDALLAIARADRRVSPVPPPVVVVKTFQLKAVELELRCFVPDVDLLQPVSTDLRFAIWKALRKPRIDPSPPQQITQIPQLTELLSRLEQRAGAGP